MKRTLKKLKKSNNRKHLNLITHPSSNANAHNAKRSTVVYMHGMYYMMALLLTATSTAFKS